MRPPLIVALGVALLVASPAQAGPAWLGAAPIPGEGTPAREARVAFGDDGTLVAAWHEGAGGTQTIKTATRPPGGSFGPVDTLAGPATGLGSARVAVDGEGTTLVTWVQGPGARFAVRPPGGSFEPASDVPRPAGENVGSAIEVVFDPHGTALAAWVGSQPRMTGGIDLRLRATVRPPGGSFDPPVALEEGFDNRDAIGTPSFSLTSVDVASAGDGDLITSWHSSCCLVGSEVSSVRVVVRPPGGPFNAVETVDSGSTQAGTGVLSPQLAGSAQGSAIVVWGKMQTLTTGQVAACWRAPGGSFTGCAIEDVSDSGSTPEATDVGLDGQGNAVAVWSRKLPTGADPYAVQTAGRAAGSLAWTPLNTFSEPGVDLAQPQLASSRQGAAIVAWRRGMDRIDGAAKAGGAVFGPSQPLSASGGNPVFPDVAMDPDGNGAAAWERIPPPDTLVEVAGYDGAGPRLSGLSIPAGGDTGQPLTFGVGATDVWSAVQSVGWSFGDGAAAPGAQVTHTYEPAGGSFTATVTAVDSLGNATSGSGTTLIRDTIRPVLSRLRMARRRFAVGRARTPLVARRVPRGSAFRFRLSEPATVKIRIDRKLLRGGRTVYRRVAVLTRRRQRTGSNRVRFSGRIKRRALRRGAYRATLRAVDATGNRSGARKTSFSITQRR